MAPRSRNRDRRHRIPPPLCTRRVREFDEAFLSLQGTLAAGTGAFSGDTETAAISRSSPGPYLRKTISSPSAAASLLFYVVSIVILSRFSVLLRLMAGRDWGRVEGGDGVTSLRKENQTHPLLLLELQNAGKVVLC